MKPTNNFIVRFANLTKEINKNKLESVIDSKEELNYEEKVLVKFLKPLIGEKLLTINILTENLEKEIKDRKAEQKICRKFYQNFIEEKQAYKEKSFKFFEIAEYIHENKYNQ